MEQRNNRLNLSTNQLEALRDANFTYIPKWRWEYSDFIIEVMKYLDNYPLDLRGWKELIWTIYNAGGMSEKVLKEIAKRSIDATFMTKEEWDYDKIKCYLYQYHSWIDIFERVFNKFSKDFKLCNKIITDIVVSPDYGTDFFWMLDCYDKLTRYLYDNIKNPYALLTLYELEQNPEFPEDLCVEDGRILRVIAKINLDLKLKFDFLMAVDWAKVDFFKFSYAVRKICDEIDEPYNEGRTFHILLKLLPMTVREDPRFYDVVSTESLLSGEFTIPEYLPDEELFFVGCDVEKVLAIRLGECFSILSTEKKLKHFAMLNHDYPNETLRLVEKYNLLEKLQMYDVSEFLMNETNKGTPLHELICGE